MTEPATPPEPRCQVCDWPPNGTSSILAVGPGDTYVDMGHMGAEYGYVNCFTTAQKEVQARGRAALLAQARVS